MSKVLSGPKAIFKIAGSKVAYASDVSYTINHDHAPIEVLDNLPVIEYAEVGYSVNFSCTTFRVARKSAIGLGIQPKLEDILTQPELTAEIIDAVEGVTLLRLTGVKMTSRSGSVGARSVSSETWSFVALKAGDESSD